MSFPFFYSIEDLITLVLDHRKPDARVSNSHGKKYVLPRSAGPSSPGGMTLAQLEAAIKMAVGADCYDYAMAKWAEMEEKSESSSDADLCENKFVIDMSSLTDDELCYFPQELLANFDMCTQKLLTYTEWKGAPAASLNDYITNYAPDGVDLAKCKIDCLEDISKICSKEVNGTETLSVFFKCPSWDDAQGPTKYCQQQLEAPEKEDQCAGFTQTSPSLMLLLCILFYFLK